ncbi:1,4-alpha-glucan branching protein [Streptomyces sp. WAC06614]|uniref:maltokinase N-terminal cap-like domain-containing protein n=1 Tax=Streptomyces sp. WAC06614 TaxID=2487416 RepID=UPI000F79D030|nr:1,4-alpha-glucan branching protein [Streptomyces sp. WAC06614]RSS82287.1 1,4-alpha-glucan branching protein [Streptomyces sp. WAC06614]
MAHIHRTTMSPTKLELLAGWLPSRPWYVPTGRAPEPVRAGGFRLDDPRGEVGIEFMVVADASGDAPAAYLVPLTYRGAPLEGAEQALVGTSEHGVLGTRWIYDGTHDPVLVAQLLALLQGRAEPQAQSESDTPDPTVHVSVDPTAATTAAASDVPGTVGDFVVSDRADGTELVLGDAPTGPLTLGVSRLLRPAAPDAPAPAGALARVTAPWAPAEGAARVRGPVAVLRAGAR